MLVLKLTRDGEELEFQSGLITIGRAGSNVVVVSDPRVSSIHAEIVRRGDAFYFRDLGSTNGSLVRRHEDQVDIVVDGRRVREVRLSDGDQLRLGDRAKPVCFGVHFQQLEEAKEGGTVVARRAAGSIEALGTQVVENPLASRQTLALVFNFFGQLGKLETRKDLADRLSAFLLDLLSKTRFVATFFRVPDSGSKPGKLKPAPGDLQRVSLVARDAAKTPVVDVDQLLDWFAEALDEQASVAIEPPRALREGQEALAGLAAVPLPGAERALGAALLGRRAPFSDFDLDLLSLIAHQAAGHLERLALIQELRDAGARLARENRDLRQRLAGDEVERTIIGQSPSWNRALAQAERVADTGTTVLILGETGTGKELVARLVHSKSRRADRPFAAVNCGALTESLLESELFGYVKGAFTGAERDKRGLVRTADGGTLFLDEIGDVTPALQVKLLRVLEEGEVTPVGANLPVKVDIRIIAATHRDLEEEVEAGRFREDLYYRINVFPVRLPPLRQRAGDVERLAEHFLAHFTGRLGKSIPGFSDEVIERFKGYEWPGNVRELQNEIHRLAVLADEGRPIGVELLSERISGFGDPARAGGSLKEVIARYEEQFIRRVLADHDDNRTRTAEALGISRQALTDKLRRYGLVDRRS
jgi:transcriptional regulator with GAF, ATPase, and Fis domain/pSer/pThr/pTyr-binding forkhead associated (FHA) protein